MVQSRLCLKFKGLNHIDIGIASSSILLFYIPAWYYQVIIYNNYIIIILNNWITRSNHVLIWLFFRTIQTHYESSLCFEQKISSSHQLKIQVKIWIINDLFKSTYSNSLTDVTIQMAYCPVVYCPDDYCPDVQRNEITLWIDSEFEC